MPIKAYFISLCLLLGMAATSYSQAETRIVYDFGRIYSIRPDGTDLKQISNLPADALGNLKFLAVSPDGRRMAFRAHISGHTRSPIAIWTMAFDGSDRTRLTLTHLKGEDYLPTHQGALENDSRPDWSPDGLKIAFDGYRSDEMRAIYVINADGNNLTQLTDSLNAYSPSWSPDGRQIVYARAGKQKVDPSRGIWKMNADGTDKVQLTVEGREPDWSPRGDKIAFLRQDTSALAPADYYDIWTMDIDGSNQINLTPGRTIIPVGKTIDDLAWSPNGSQIVFHRWFEFTVPPLISIINADGTNLVHLTNGYNPTWMELSPSQPFASDGDFNGDGKVDLFDFFEFADAFGSTESVYDLDGNGLVDLSDFFRLADLFDTAQTLLVPHKEISHIC